MHKDEIILLHLTFFQLERMFREAGFINDYFLTYERLGVLPSYIHMSKNEHKKATLILCMGILEILAEEEEIDDIVRNKKLKSLVTKPVKSLS